MNAANSWLERHNPFKAVIFSLLAFPPQKIRCTFPANQNTFNINGIHWRGNRHKLKICLARGENVMACRTAFQVVSVHLIFISPRPPQRLLLLFFPSLIFPQSVWHWLEWHKCGQPFLRSERLAKRGPGASSGSPARGNRSTRRRWQKKKSQMTEKDARCNAAKKEKKESSQHSGTGCALADQIK